MKHSVIPLPVRSYTERDRVENMLVEAPQRTTRRHEPHAKHNADEEHQRDNKHNCGQHAAADDSHDTTSLSRAQLAHGNVAAGCSTVMPAGKPGVRGRP